jgi:hypothetical protein
MPFPKRFPFKRQDTSAAVQQQTALEDSKGPEPDIQSAPSRADEVPDKYVPDQEAQGGVQKVEAITLSWTRPELIIAYISYVQPRYHILG